MYLLNYIRDVVEPTPLLVRPFIGLLYQPWMVDGDNCGAISDKKERHANVNDWEKCALVLQCPPEIPHDLTGTQPRWEAGEKLPEL
jgi:hypothetical protein